MELHARWKPSELPEGFKVGLALLVSDCVYTSKAKWRYKAMILINQAKNNSLQVRNRQWLRHELSRLTTIYVDWIHQVNTMLPYLVCIDNKKIYILWSTSNIKLCACISLQNMVLKERFIPWDQVHIRIRWRWKKIPIFWNENSMPLMTTYCP